MMHTPLNILKQGGGWLKTLNPLTPLRTLPVVALLTMLIPACSTDDPTDDLPRHARTPAADDTAAAGTLRLSCTMDTTWKGVIHISFGFGADSI